MLSTGGSPGQPFRCGNSEAWKNASGCKHEAAGARLGTTSDSRGPGVCSAIDSRTDFKPSSNCWQAHQRSGHIMKRAGVGAALGVVVVIGACGGNGGQDGGTAATGTTTAGTTASAWGGSTGATVTTTSSSGGGGTTGQGTSTGGTTGGTGTSTGGSTGGGVAVGTPCVPTASPDTVCAPVGLFCQAHLLLDGGTVGLCALPIDQSACLPSVGCATGFFCVPGVFGHVHGCVQACQQSSDCTALAESCVSGAIAPNDAGCLLNFCGPGSNPANGNAYYTSCNAQGVGEGTCYPLPPYGGVCVQGGSIALNQPCDQNRGGLLGMCRIGDICTVLDVTISGETLPYSACLPACSVRPPTAPDGGPGCDAGSVCKPFGPGLAFGICWQTCKLANPVCPYPLGCINMGDPINGVCGPF
jgi:hypothetical protein